MADWLSNWIEDIDDLAAELPRLHLNLFHQLPEHAFRSQIRQLKADLFDCDDAMVMTRLMAIIASVGDAHTALMPVVRHYLPFDFYWFEEGLFIVAARPELQNWCGAKVVAIENTPIADVIADLTSILSHENLSFVNAQLPSYLAAVDLLYGLEICDHLDEVRLTLQQADGKPAKLKVSTMKPNGRAANMVQMGDDASVPLYRQHRDLSFWFSRIESDTVYVHYNACKEPEDGPIAAAFNTLLDEINHNQPKKIIIDLRFNLGGDSTLLDPLIEELAAHPARLFVIIGRNTFSSALLNAYALKNKTRAIVVGEPSGGKPNCYGEVQYLTLPNSKLRVRYSTKYYQLIAYDGQLSLLPDLPCPVTFADYQAGFDPCLQIILDDY